MARNQKIAVIGGGISGIYLAWRLEQILPDHFEIAVYEKEVSSAPGEPRLGGRIRTCDIHLKEVGQSIRLNAELGAMRFPDRHLVLSSLVERLRLGEENSKGHASGNGHGNHAPFKLNTLFYVRGKVLAEKDFAQEELVPYRLRDDERGKSPEDLLQYAIQKALDQITLEPSDPLFMARLREKVAAREFIDCKEWLELSSRGVFDGIRLRDIGFWNLIKHFLSSEAFLLCQDGFGFMSVISNWNASEAFKWLVADFAPGQKFMNVRGGFSQLIGRLRGELTRTTFHLAQLSSVAWENHRRKFSLSFVGNSGTEADYLVLALPPKSLQKIDVEGVDGSWERLVKSSRPHRLEKIALVYKDPWWEKTNIPGGPSGRVFTDLPMRQIYYFDPDWLSRSNFSDSHHYSMILIYNDSLYEGFWRTFSVYKDVYIGESASDEWLRRALGPLPREVDGNGIEVNVVGEEEVRLRMEEKIRAQLRELHQVNVPTPVKVPMALAGVHRDWADVGGWHTWEPFVDVGNAKKTIIQPFCNTASGLKIWSSSNGREGVKRIPLFVCGEAYAWEQGWIEGALMSAEALAAELGETLAGTYRAPDWINQLHWQSYMEPEFKACPTYRPPITKGREL